MVSLEFASELQAGTQITALVHRISKRADTLLKLKTPPATATVNLVAHGENVNDDIEAAAEAVNRVNIDRNFRPKPDGQNWRSSRSTFNSQHGTRSKFEPATHSQRQGSLFSTEAPG